MDAQNLLDRAPEVKQAMLDGGTTEEEFNEMIEFLKSIVPPQQ